MTSTYLYRAHTVLLANLLEFVQVVLLPCVWSAGLLEGFVHSDPVCQALNRKKVEYTYHGLQSKSSHSKLYLILVEM